MCVFHALSYFSCCTGSLGPLGADLLPAGAAAALHFGVGFCSDGTRVHGEDCLPRGERQCLQATAPMAADPSLCLPAATGMDGDDTVTTEVCKEADVGDGE